MKNVICNRCGKEMYEEDLVLYFDENEYYKGCPSCKTDAYLMDIDNQFELKKVYTYLEG